MWNVIRGEDFSLAVVFTAVCVWTVPLLPQSVFLSLFFHFENLFLKFFVVSFHKPFTFNLRYCLTLTCRHLLFLSRSVITLIVTLIIIINIAINFDYRCYFDPSMHFCTKARQIGAQAESDYSCTQTNRKQKQQQNGGLCANPIQACASKRFK